MYKQMYYRLFNAVTKAMEQLARGEDQEAYQLLKQAQIETEALYMDGDDQAE